MKKVRRSKADEAWLKALGGHLQKLIKASGYKSPYDFWVQAAGDEISRATLNYILIGKVDVRVSTLRKLASLLKVDIREFFNF